MAELRPIQRGRPMAPGSPVGSERSQEKGNVHWGGRLRTGVEAWDHMVTITVRPSREWRLMVKAQLALEYCTDLAEVQVCSFSVSLLIFLSVLA